ncbi:TetR/AcrR family transcriptional regulator [Nocardiopsis alborubida]|uniref:TetR/AcrR family transcriptional regulator n=1 Tax=Nocardiopsis alborubida TaxID=146802 RepID=A0A7X6M9R5_9ACTN|nr:TetR/AcrR family transcriptional regulator [Nocardiopsis alborubida]NKY96974.1 TetR/AcrR family transcriptional regulator [Nocardiopsis alborubida]
MVDRERPRADDEAREAARDAREEAPRATRRRGRELLDAIHEAVILEAADVGVARLSMEGVARRAGTAKTSLYRRWPTPGDILLDAMYHTYPQEQPAPGADDLRGDLVGALMLLRDTMSRSLGQAMFSVVAEARHHPELYDRFVREVFDSRGGRFTRTVLQHYADHGRIDPSRVTSVTVDIGEAMLIKYAMDHQGPPGQEYVERIVDEVILPALGLDPRDPSPAAPEGSGSPASSGG